MNDRAVDDWGAFVERYKACVIALGEEAHPLLERLQGARGLGGRFHSLPEEVAHRLPRSYLALIREFGALPLPSWTGSWELLHPSQVRFLAAGEPQLVEVWSEAGSREGVDFDPNDYREPSRMYWSAAGLRASIQISSIEDGSVLLLTPHDGDNWESWHLGTTIPGVIRYPTFVSLMEAQLEELCGMGT